MRSKNKYSLPCKKENIEIVISDPRAHFDIRKHAVDFALPEGSEIIAAQSGKVFRLRESSNEGGDDKKYATNPEFTNRIVLAHDNGEYSEYAHLKHKGVKVEMGDEVEKGQVIALSGNTGYTTRPHLRFHVLHEVDNKPGWETLDIQWQNDPEISRQEKRDGRKVAYFDF